MKFYLGEHPKEYMSEILLQEKPKKVFLVHGKGSYKTCGAELFISESLSKEIDCFSFWDFEENPKEEDLQRGLSLLKDKNIDLVIAIGGGSVLDMAKLLRFYYNLKVPLVAIPTTAGTGSEATHFAVLYKDGIKHSIADEKILPNYAIINYKFTLNTPAYLTACAGFDALAQAIESYWNVNANKESLEYSKKAISLLWGNLPIAVNSPTIEVRKKIAEGSFWAGRAINITKTTAPHACSYPFTMHYGYPHGHAVALTFPYWAEYNISLNLQNLSNSLDKNEYISRLEYLKVVLGLSIGSDIYSFFKSYISSLGLKSLSKIQINLSAIKKEINVDRLSNNPIKIRESDIDLLLNILSLDDKKPN